jgi:hypothetical protein
MNIEIIIDDSDIKILSLLALPALPHHGNGTVLTPKLLPARPLPPPSCISALCSSTGDGRETMMTMMTIQEAMTTVLIFDPVCPTHNN